MQAHAAHARVREARMHRGGIPNALVQSCIARSDRASGSQAGRGAAQPSAPARRFEARHRRVQHHRRRMARGEAAPAIQARPTALTRRPGERMLVDFFLHLKAAKLPVSTREFLTLLDALEHGVISGDIDDFYFLARTCLVKDEALYDRFNLAFGTYFNGVDNVFDIRAEIPEEWIRKLIEGNLSEEDKALVKALGGWEALMEILKRRLEEQRGRHQGGSKWIGTAGTSPFGAYGYNPEGIRIGQEGGRGRSAIKVWDERTFRN